MVFKIDMNTVISIYRKIFRIAEVLKGADYLIRICQAYLLIPQIVFI